MRQEERKSGRREATQTFRPSALPVCITLCIGLACCSPSTVEQRRLADGSWQVTCTLPMDECVRRADVLCSAQRYRILRGRSRHVVLGAAPSQVNYRTSELTLLCGDEEEGNLPDASAPEAASPTPDASAPEAAPPKPDAPAPEAAPQPPDAGG